MAQDATQKINPLFTSQGTIDPKTGQVILQPQPTQQSTPPTTQGQITPPPTSISPAIAPNQSPVAPQPPAPTIQPPQPQQVNQGQIQDIQKKFDLIKQQAYALYPQLQTMTPEQLKSQSIVGQTIQDTTGAIKDQTTTPPPETQDYINQGFQTLQNLSAQYQQLTQGQPTMVDTYNKLLADTGITADKQSLVDINNIIRGSEDDIRNEITHAGGFATESQIQALVAQRNKSLILRSQALSDSINAKEDYVDKVVQLTGEDRKAVSDRLDAQFGFTEKQTQLQLDLKKTKFSQSLDYKKFLQQQQQDASNLIIAKAKSGALTSASEETIQRLSKDSGGKFSVDEIKSLQSAAKLKDQVAMEGLLLSKQIMNGINNANVQSLPSGEPNPVDQNKFLSQFSPYIQTQIKGVANYSINPADYPTYTRKGVDQVNRAQIVTLAQQYDPTYDDKQYPVRAAFLKAWTAGGQNAVSQAANTAIQHLGELKTIYDQIKISPNAGILNKKYADLQAFIKANENVPQVAQFGTIVNSLSGELAKIYKNGINSSASPTEIEEQNQQKVFSLGWGQNGLNGIVESTLNLMRDRLITAQETYTNTMGKPPTNILLPTAQKTLDDLKAKGLNVDFSGLNPMNNASDSDLFNSILGSGGSANVNNSQLFNSALNLINSINLQNQ